LAVQRIDHTGHRVTDGTLFVDGRSVNVSIYAQFEYSLTDRLAFAAGLPYVFGKYVDPSPPPPFFPFLPVDQCRCWNSGAQDLEFATRFNILSGRFGLTPSVAIVLPSHNYGYGGEASLGRHLPSVRFALDAGQRLDMITPRLAVSGGYAYELVERVLGIPNNRSTASVGASYLVRRRLSAHGEVIWQRTHGGLRVGAPLPFDLSPPGDVNTPERLAQHDRMLRDNNMRAGGGVTYELPRFDVFVSYLAFVSGTDTHAGRAVNAGITWPFEIHR
jgi:hypothetical protein